ncbi:MAG: PilN domain-containing protein [Planctomycetales bacterium]|nr:PilN domain-containing protein [Planctomycetales bacterium]
MTEASHPADLVAATDRVSAIVERRSSKSTWRLGSDRRKNAALSVGLEISPAGVALAVVRHDQATGIKQLTTDYTEFEPTSGPAQGNWTTDELSKALISLSEKHRLIGQAVHVGLGGEPCVTRQSFGENEQVNDDVAELTERTHRYLSLGRGEKVCCYAERQIDAKRKRTWVTVAHRGFIEAVAQAVESAGLRLARMEHTLSTICEAIGATGRDQQQPVLIVAKGSGRPEMAVSFQGQLILDYRPPRAALGEGMVDLSGIAAIGKHIKCVSRFAQSQLPRGSNEIREICLPGVPAVSANEIDNVKRMHGLMPIPLSTSILCDDLVAEQDILEHVEIFASVWLARRSMRENAPLAANLMHSLSSNAKLSASLYVKTLWPLAACLLLVCGLYVASHFKNNSLLEAEAKLESLQPQRLEVQRLRRLLMDNRENIRQVKSLQRTVRPVAWNDILKFTGRALPSGTWLKSIRIERDNTVVVSGASFADDAIYEYVNRLRDSRLFELVTLGATKTVRLRSGPAFEFEISTQAGVLPASEPEVQVPVSHTTSARTLTAK